MSMSAAAIIKSYSDTMLIQTLINKKSPASLISLPTDMLTSTPKEDSADISNIANKLNSISQKLDATGSETAKAGLRHVVKHFASDSEGFDDFMSSVDKLSKADYAKVFSTIDKMADKGLNEDKFMDTFASLDTDEQKQLMNITSKIIKDDKSGSVTQKEAYNKLMKSIDTIQNSDSDDKDEQIQGLLNAASGSKSAVEMKAAIDKYNKSIASK